MTRTTRTARRATAALLAGVAALAGLANVGATSASAATSRGESVQATANPSPSSYYQIKVRSTGLRMETANASTANLGPILQGGGTSTTYRPSHWLFQNLGNGHYRVVNRHSSLCLTVQGSSTEDRIPLVQVTCGSASSQQWRLDDTDSGYFTMTARHSGKPAGVYANLRYVHAPFAQESIAGSAGAWKQFRLERVF